MKHSAPYVQIPIRFYSLSLPQLLKTHHPPSISHNCGYIHTGQSSANHAFRTTVPDLDHSIPPPHTDLHLYLPPAKFGFESACQVLVARACNLSRDRSELDDPSFMDVCYDRTWGRGCLHSHPRVQASHAMAYRRKSAFHRADELLRVAVVPA
jgi:hypothetical protein